MDFISKLSLYDVLTMLVSGFLILVLFIPIPTEDQSQWFLPLILVLSYLVGIVYHRLLEFIRQIMGKLLENETSCRIIKTLFVSNAIEAIKRAKEKVYKTKCDTDDKKTKDKYYLSYDIAVSKPGYSNISLLESQEAFLRNMTWIVVAYIIVPWCNGFNCCCCCCVQSTGIEFIWYLKESIGVCCLDFVIVTMLLLFLILFARYQTQMKIYKLVWEAAKYSGL